MKKQAHLELSGAKVVEHLPAIGRTEHRTGLHLDDDEIVDDEVHFVSADLHSLVKHGNQDFARHFVPASLQLQHERPAIHIFQKAKTKLVVHGKKTLDDHSRDLRVEQLALQFYPCRFMAVSGRFVVHNG